MGLLSPIGVTIIKKEEKTFFFFWGINWMNNLKRANGQCLVSANAVWALDVCTYFTTWKIGTENNRQD